MEGGQNALSRWPTSKLSEAPGPGVDEAGGEEGVPVLTRGRSLPPWRLSAAPGSAAPFLLCGPSLSQASPGLCPDLLSGMVHTGLSYSISLPLPPKYHWSQTSET